MRKFIPILISLMAALCMASCLPGAGQQGTGLQGADKPVVELANPGQDIVSDFQEPEPSDFQEADEHGSKETEYSESKENGNHGSKETEYSGSHGGGQASQGAKVKEKGQYTDKDRVALYIHTYRRLPRNYITKREAQSLGWESQKGNLRKVAPGKSIGGDKFGNYEGQLPKAKNRKYYECDIDYTGGKRNAKRIIFSNDGLVFYTGDHYKTFQQLY